MTIDSLINVLALVFSVLSIGLTIGMLLANKKNDR